MTYRPKHSWCIAAHDGTPARENDGSIIIMEGSRDNAENYRRVAAVSMQIKPKRGEAWKTRDPEQEAIAQFIVDAANAALERK